MPWAFIALGSAGLLAWEKAGDWWNARAGIVTVPVEQVAGRPSASGSGTLLLIGAGLGAAYFLLRSR